MEIAMLYNRSLDHLPLTDQIALMIGAVSLLVLCGLLIYQIAQEIKKHEVAKFIRKIKSLK